MMRRSELLLMLGLAGCARGGDRSASEAAAAQRGARIVTLGDSLAFGTGASSPRNGFVFQAYLRVRERDPGARIDNVSINGARAADVLRLQAPLVGPHQADVVVICVGGNDAVHHVPTPAFAASYASILSRVRALRPRAAIICCGVPNIGLCLVFSPPERPGLTVAARAHDAAVRAAARAAGASFVDLYGVTARARGDADRFFSDDGFHPSDIGYAAFADALAPVLLAAVDRVRR